MQQRVGLARALATEADIPLIDEPFSALDPFIRRKLQDELRALQERVRKAILFVSHDRDEALELGAKVTILEGGRIVQTGSAGTAARRPSVTRCDGGVRGVRGNMPAFGPLKITVRTFAHRRITMRSSISGGFVVIAVLLGASVALAQSQPAAPAAKPAASASTHQRNINEYIGLLRQDVRREKSRVVGTAMELSQDEAAKFWPIYKEYDAQLTKLNDVRIGNITAYAQNYRSMTENKADEIVNGAIAYHKKRIDLLANTYDKMRAALGAGKAARFVQVEATLLNLIDLNIQSELPLMWGPAPAAKPAAK